MSLRKCLSDPATHFSHWLLLGAIGFFSIVGFAPSATAQQYRQTNLVSDIPQLAAVTDPNLVNPWGIVRSATSPWWVADNVTGVSTLYNGSGQRFPPPPNGPLVVSVPPHSGGSGTGTPTGIVFNGSSDFEVAPGQPARFIFVTLDGTISGWNPMADPTNAVRKVDNSSNLAIYTGATIASSGFASYLYVANFHSGRVEVFDAHFDPVNLPPEAFVDSEIPADFAPFNVQTVNGSVFVAFAKQDEDKEDEVAGAGLGFVDAFDPTGHLVMRLKSGHWMDAPWAVVMAPTDFGKFSNDILVGNLGSGRIAAFDSKHGNFHGFLRGLHGLPIAIEGLWGLSFGNGGTAGPTNTLFFAAGIDDEQHGLFGTLTPE